MSSGPLRILIVCSGNICRSPMAEVITRRLLEERGITDATVESGGTLGIEGQPADPHARRAVRVLELDLEDHRSRGIPAASLDQATHILAMAGDHVREILFRRPQYKDRIVKLWEFTDKPRRLTRIEDPVSQPYKQFAACRDDLRECLVNWLDSLKLAPPQA